MLFFSAKDTPNSRLRRTLTGLAAASALFLTQNALAQDKTEFKDAAFSRENWVSHAKRSLPQQTNTEADFAGYDVHYYGLNLDVQITQRHISGYADIGLRITEPRSAIVVALAAPLTVDSVRAGNLRPTISSPTGRGLRTISFPNPLPADTSFALRIYYRGTPDQSYRSIVFGDDGTTPFMWTLSEPYGAMYWFPVKNVPSDKADSADIRISVPSSLKVASNGLLLADSVSSGKRYTHWKTRYPMAMYLLSVSIADYRYFENWFRWENDSMPVVNYWYPSDNLENRKIENQATLQQLALFSQKFGLYPFFNEKYGHARVTFSGGMEHQTLSSMVNLSESLSAHELMHQWFGDAVTCARWEDIWFNEGFASFGELLWVEHSLGGEAGKLWRAGRHNNAIPAQNGVLVLSPTAVDFGNPAHVSNIFNYRLSYVKASIVVDMLRYVLGETEFYRIMTKLVQQTWRNKSITTPQFQAFVEAESGRELNWFFAQWLYGNGFPDYAVTWESSRLAGGRYDVKVRVKQTPRSSTITFFRMPLEFRMKGISADTTVRFDNTLSDQLFTLSMAQEPTGLEFDPDVHVLKGSVTVVRNRVDETPGTLPDRTAVESIFPNPFNPEARVKFTLRNRSNVRLKIIDNTGRTVKTIALGTFAPGLHESPLRADGLASGAYTCVLEASGFTSTYPFTVVK
jgi:aminopeptidase N